MGSLEKPPTLQVRSEENPIVLVRWVRLVSPLTTALQYGACILKVNAFLTDTAPKRFNQFVLCNYNLPKKVKITPSKLNSLRLILQFAFFSSKGQQMHAIYLKALNLKNNNQKAYIKMEHRIN